MYDVSSYPNINRIWTGLLVDALAERGMTNFFSSPGLRNAPLLSSANLNEKTIVHSGIDERAMAFRSLGFAKATGIPGVLLCTSGSALANYFPAVIEASQSNIPLIVISADRPRRLVELGDNQAIDQINFYGKYVKNELAFDLPSEQIEPQDVLDKINRYLDSNNTGPLHINFPFDEPLDKGLDNTSLEYRELANKARNSKLIEQSQFNFELPKLNKNKKTLIVVGPTPEYEKKSQLKELIKDSSLPCLLDIGSGLKFSDIPSNRILPSFEHPEIKTLLEKNKPEQIIHLGGRLVSKHYYSFLKENPEIEVLLVGNKNQYTHPAQSPKWELKAPLNSFCDKAKQENYLKDLVPYTFDCNAIVGMKEDIIENSPFSFPAISKRLIELIPDGASLYLGNSTSIRSFDAFASTNTHSKNIKVLTHRGASGIEGFNAAALGYAEAEKESTILVHGDISFMHDLNSLLMYKDKKLPLINIVVNNKGGGIFKHLPIADDEETLPLITTEHDHNFKQLCQWLEIDYFEVNSISGFESALGPALKKQGICIIEATIDQLENLAVYERLKTLKL